MNAITKIESGALSTMTHDEVINTLRNSLYPGASVQSVAMVLDYCRAAGLDPLLKPVHIVPMYVKGPDGRGEMRDVVLPGIGLYRIQANRTGQYAGQDEPKWGPVSAFKVGDWELMRPEWCTVTVYRLVQGHRAPFSATVYWDEAYATKGRDSKLPNSMWSKRVRGQLEKCAEALALRKAFPELGAAPTAEEMEGKTWDGGDEPVPEIRTPAVKQPQPQAAREVIDAETGEVVQQKQPEQKPTGRAVDAGKVAWVRGKLKAFQVPDEAQAQMRDRIGITSWEAMTEEQFAAVKAELMRL